MYVPIIWLHVHSHFGYLSETRWTSLPQKPSLNTFHATIIHITQAIPFVESGLKFDQ
jgi:hypothetical protein